jgi:saccharopine dehydrogenase (NADP+, L-glutamate forming)
MKTILLFGAGKSSTVLIEYLIRQAPEHGFFFRVIDANASLAKSKLSDSSFGEALGLDITDDALRLSEVRRADIVISLLPPQLHLLVANDCLQAKKHLLTASYVTNELKALDSEARSHDLLFLCEMGLDPGIDHMSAMALLNEIRAEGGIVDSFVSHCGGLVAPESDNNPWHYKISWNPRNVVTAGQAGALYLLDGKEVNLSYEQLFAQENTVAVSGLGSYAWYPNRDSLSYLSLYNLTSAKTFIRTTLRHLDFMKGWRKLIQLSLTKDTPIYHLPHATLGTAFEHHFTQSALQQEVERCREEDPLFDQQLHFLGADKDSTPLVNDPFTPALLLQEALEKKLVLAQGDRDMIVMLHEIGYRKEGQDRKITSQLVVTGDDSRSTAMAKTVGLPLAMAALQLLQEKIRLRGMQIPTHPEIYTPVLQALKKEGITFTDTDHPAMS